jgi:hypothetical protein
MFACTLPPRRVVVTRDETGQSATRAIAKIDILEVIERLDVRARHQCHYRGKAPVVPFSAPPDVELVPIRRKEGAFTSSIAASFPTMARNEVLAMRVSLLWPGIRCRNQVVLPKH